MSVDLKIGMEGIPGLQGKLNRLGDAVKVRVRNVFSREEEPMKNAAWRRCPVKTGYLRSKIFCRARDWRLVLGADADYAVYQEFGTIHITPRKFLRGALKERLPILFQNLDAAVEGGIREAAAR